MPSCDASTDLPTPPAACTTTGVFEAARTRATVRGFRNRDELLRDLQERWRRQQLVRRSPKRHQHHLRGDQRVRLKGGGTRANGFLQPQRAVVRRSRQ